MKETWWKEAVVYQVYWRSFFDSNGDGIGDLRGVIKKLDYIKELGADVIWLNPFYSSPDDDNGYDISDYYAVMPKAGTMEDFEELLEKAHHKGLKVIMDLVVNHTSDQHPWFLESRSNQTNPKRDWYIWRDGKKEGPPNNWRSYFEPSTWTYDEESHQYYFHSFAKSQPDLNWENEELRNEIYEMMHFWLKKGIDGFRMDVVNLIKKIPRFPDAENPIDISYLGNNPGVHDFLQEMNQRVLQHYDVFTVGEIPFVQPEDGVLYVGEDRNELSTLFHFEVCDDMTTMDVHRFKEIQKRWYEGMWGKGWNSQFLNNHDHTRLVTRFGNDSTYRVESAKMLATLLHTLPGMPCIFQGEEIGMTGISFDTIDEYDDIALKNKYYERIQKGEDPIAVLKELQLLARDNSRTPVQWGDSEHAGFTKGTPWFPVNSNYTYINVEQAMNDPQSIFAYYQTLISLRKQYKSFVYGTFTTYEDESESIYMYMRKTKENTVLVVCNMGENEIDVTLPMSVENLLLSNYAVKDELAKSFCLRPYEARLYDVS